jgi:hypothetical protein
MAFSSHSVLTRRVESGLRFNQSSGRSRVEAFTDPFVALPPFESSLTSGIYRIERSGTTVSGWISEADGANELFLGERDTWQQVCQQLAEVPAPLTSGELAPRAPLVLDAY